MSDPNRIHVVERPDDNEWGVRREGADRDSARERTQGEAVERAKEIARNSGGGEVVTHAPRSKGGVFRDSDTIGRPDPNPPKDKKH